MHIPCGAIFTKEPMVSSSQIKPNFILFWSPKENRAAFMRASMLRMHCFFIALLRYTLWLARCLH